MHGLDLFAGIGLFSLGMEEAGIETVAAAIGRAIRETDRGLTC